MKTKTVFLLSVLLILAAVISGCGRSNSVIRSLTVKQNRKRASVLYYTPADFDFRGGHTPLLLYMSDTPFTGESALEKIESNGLRALADRESCTVVFLSPSDKKGWSDADYKKLQIVAGSTKDTWFPGDTFEGGVSDKLFLSSHFRLYFFAEGSAVDYVKKTLDVPGSDFLITEYGMNCGGFAAGYVYAPEGFTEGSVAAGWESVKSKTRMFTDKDTSRACVCADYNSCGISVLEKVFTAASGRSIGYYEYVPDSIAPDAVTPLVVLFHGRGMHPDAYAYQSTWPKTAAAHGFRIISVAGPYDQQNSPDIDTSITADTYALISDYVSSNPIDAGRVYLTGFSMGAFRVLDLAARYPGVFAAIAPCDPIRRTVDFTAPVPVFFFGGAIDNYGIFPTQNVWCGPMVQNMAAVNDCAPDYGSGAGNLWNIRFDSERTVTDEDTGLVIRLGELKDSTGKIRIILSEAEQMGHSVLPAMAELIWAFFDSVA